VLRAAGYDAHSEYYINDAGRQMDILALSVWLRYLELCAQPVSFPGNAYQGSYVVDIAREVKQQHDDAYCHPGETLFTALPENQEEAIDLLIERCKSLLGEQHYRILFDIACNAMVDDIRQDLEEFGVVFQQWFSERGMVENGDIEKSIRKLEENGR
jgi:arginyl-tRNA synthetase